MKEADKRKNTILWVVVGLVTLVILLIWLANLSNAWQARQALVQPFGQFGLDEIKEEIGGAVDWVESSTSDIELEPAVTPPEIDVSEKAAELVKELEGLAEAKQSTSSPRACPEYIDCMPTIGPAKPCQIPPGCEGITQIAY